VAELARIETVVFLQSADLFSYCKAEEILRIALIAHERRYAAGESVYRRNDPADALYCVVRGEVQLEDAAGQIRRIGPLGSFGVMELLSDRLRASEASATADSLILTIEADDFFDLLSGTIEIVKALFRQLVRRGHIAPQG
jgi:CRP-like cAMP-binding protein